MNITINGITKEDTAYDKQITFEREGVEYSALLHWDSWSGYDLTFLQGRKNTTAPKWAIEWNEDKEGTLEYVLDCLTDEVLYLEKEGER